MAKGETLIGVGYIVIAAVVTGVFSMIMGHEFLTVLFIRMCAVIGIDRKPIFHGPAAKQIIDLVLGNKELSLRVIAIGGTENNRFSL